MFSIIMLEISLQFVELSVSVQMRDFISCALNVIRLLYISAPSSYPCYIKTNVPLMLVLYTF